MDTPIIRGHCYNMPLVWETSVYQRHQSRYLGTWFTEYSSVTSLLPLVLESQSTVWVVIHLMYNYSTCCGLKGRVRVK